MIMLVRRYKIEKDVSIEQIAELVGEGLVPKLKRIRGLRSYHIMKFDDSETGSVSVFEDLSSIQEANEVARDWVHENLRTKLQLISKDVWETLYDT
jgi:hypothetical protein